MTPYHKASDVHVHQHKPSQDGLNRHRGATLPLETCLRVTIEKTSFIFLVLVIAFIAT